MNITFKCRILSLLRFLGGINLQTLEASSETATHVICVKGSLLPTRLLGDFKGISTQVDADDLRDSGIVLVV